MEELEVALRSISNCLLNIYIQHDKIHGYSNFTLPNPISPSDLENINKAINKLNSVIKITKDIN